MIIPAAAWTRTFKEVTFHRLGAPIDTDEISPDTRVLLFLRPVVEDARAAISAIQTLHAAGLRLCSMTFAPHRSLIVDDFLDTAGGPTLAGVPTDVLDLGPVPVEDDLALILAPNAFHRAAVAPLALNGPPIARSLALYFAAVGWPQTVVAKGTVSCEVANLLNALHRAEDTPPPGGMDRAPDTIILIDRSCDPITALSPQGTYDGILDELLGANVTTFPVPADVLSAAQIKTTRPPDTPDAPGVLRCEELSPYETLLGGPVHSLVRDGSWFAARRRLAAARLDVTTAKKALSERVEAARRGGGAKDLKDLVARTRDYVARESEAVLQSELFAWAAPLVDTKDPTTRLFQTLHAAEADSDDVIVEAEKIIYDGTRLLEVLRYICVASHTVGFSISQANQLKGALVNEFGAQALVALHVLTTAGLFSDLTAAERSAPVAAASTDTASEIADGLKKFFGRAVDTVRRAISPKYAAMLKGLRLFDGGCDPFEPKDLHFAMWGYAPISCRFVESVVRNGPTGPAAKVTELIPGEFTSFTLAQPDRAPALSSTRVVTVVFIGGITRSELGALRWLQDNGFRNNTAAVDDGVRAQICVLTTGIVTAQTLLRETLRDVKSLPL